MDPISSGSEDPTATNLLTGVVSDCCPNCHASLASDQRYCLNCGQRRGKPRFTLETMAARAGEDIEAAGPPLHRSRFSPATSMVAGVATLLLAMGVGVLIGHNTDNGPQRASAPVQVLTVGGGAGTGSAATTNGSSPAGMRGAHKAGKVKPVIVHLSPKVQQAANNAASKVLGSSNTLAPNVTQGIGQSCSGGAGCQNGTFTGNFFPNG